MKLMEYPKSKIRNRAPHSFCFLDYFLNPKSEIQNPQSCPSTLLPFLLPNFFIGSLDRFAEHIDVQWFL
jgi:hypothetical protein